MIVSEYIYIYSACIYLRHGHYIKLSSILLSVCSCRVCVNGTAWRAVGNAEKEHAISIFFQTKDNQCLLKVSVPGILLK